MVLTFILLVVILEKKDVKMGKGKKKSWMNFMSVTNNFTMVEVAATVTGKLSKIGSA
jgi:hypothetical protein